MIINSIVKDKKHLNKITLLGGEELFIDIDVCSDRCLKAGMEIDSSLLEEIKHESEYKRAKSRALWYLDRMDNTEKALYEKLLRAGFDKRISAEVIAWCVEFGLVDDRRYAERFAERCCENNISKREAIHKMLQKGIEYSLAKEVLSEIECDEAEQLAELIEKKYARKLEGENGTQKVFQSLVRKGFSFSAVKQALKKYNEELEFSEE